MCCCRCHASHIMSSCALHLHTCSSQASDDFPRCPFCIPALLCPPAPPFCLFLCVSVKHSRIGPRLVIWPWCTTVDRLSSFVPFGLRLILQRLTEGPIRPHVCCSPTPLQSGPKPIQTPSILSAVRSQSRDRKPHLIWTLLTPSTYIFVSPSEFSRMKP